MSASERQGRLTVGKIAHELGISSTTVSRALSGKGRVSEATREKVLNYVKQSDFADEKMRERTKPVATGNLIFAIPADFVQLDLPFLRKCMGGVSDFAEQRGYDVLICVSDHSHTEQLERQLANKKADGVIFSQTLSNDSRLKLVHRYNIPYVAIGQTNDEYALQIDSNQSEAAFEMTRLLLNMGMRRIAYVGGNMQQTVNVDRVRGFMRAIELDNFGLEYGMIQTNLTSDFQRQDGLESILELRPECLLCSDDNMTFFVLKQLRQRGIAVPGDIRLASLYDSEILSEGSPSVSAVQIDAAAMGQTACRMLLDTLAGKAVSPRQWQPYQVILRDSTKWKQALLD